MLVVANISPKDWALFADNLEWAKKLDGGKVEFDCLLCHDTQIEQHSVDAVEKAARQYFRSVELFCYNPPYENTWPEAANTAFQSVAIQLGQFFDTHWFWWEADATPLKKGWLSAIDSAYRKGKRPFAGHIVPVMGHMNGVAVYPACVAKYCPKALYCRAAPWDVMLREETIDQTTPLNHLLAHYPRYNGVKCQIKDPAVYQRLVEAGYVLFHGCNDGSLVKVCQGEKPFDYGEHPSVKIFGVNDIDRQVDESESLWFKEAIALHKKGEKIIPYEECQKPYPSIVEQAKENGWTAGFFDLPVAEGLGHFNSGMCQDDRGQYWLVTRRWERREKMEASWHSTLHAYRFWWEGDKPLLGEPIDLVMSNDPFEEAEDPRVLFRDGHFFVSYCSWSQRTLYHAKQVFTEFDRDWKFKSALKVPYGMNNYKTPSKLLKPSEKNWCFFNHDGAWHFVYSASPQHVVVEIGKKRLIEHKTDNELKWRYGEIRGGTPPVRVGDEYFSFGHSSLPWKRRQKRYYTLCCAFEAKPPFRITRITEKPLICGSEFDSRINRGPLVTFACGSHFENGQWIVIGGCNDEQSFYLKLPHEDLLKRMTAV
jgi:predicted GH43/DUF377 family glycosyl hydrolase